MAQKSVFTKLVKDPLGAGGMFIILLAFFIAVFAYIIIPDGTPNANSMQIVLAGKKPGFQVQMLKMPKKEIASSSFLSRVVSGQPASYEEIPIRSYRSANNQLIYQEYSEQIEVLEKEIPLSQFGENGFQESLHIVSKHYLLGTDKYGRDLLSRLLLGARVSFAVGFVSVLISLLIGIPLGALAGYYGGVVDKIIMWFINVVWSIPTLLMVIAITLALSKGFWQVFIAVGFTMWVEVARIVRGQILGVKEKEYIQAAKVLGFNDLRIIFRHILPNIIAPVIVISAANFAAAILIESGLSFLGIGAQPPMPSWGSMIKDHYAYLIVDKAYLAMSPGVAIMLLVLAFMMFGNALRDALDVRQV